MAGPTKNGTGVSPVFDKGPGPTLADYTSSSQGNLIRVVEVLAEGLNPLSIAEICNRLGLSKNTVFRTLWNLGKVGWVEREGELYKLSQRLPKLGDKYINHLIEKRNEWHKKIQDFKEI